MISSYCLHLCYFVSFSGVYIVHSLSYHFSQANEIAFINSLEASNKRHDILARHQGHEARYNDIMEERQRKNEEKAAKEEAVQVTTSNHEYIIVNII